MIRPLADKKDIDRAYAVFSLQLLEGGKSVQAMVGCPDGNEATTLTWHTDKQLWVLLEPHRLENCFRCAFGIENPEETEAVSVTCEITPPHSGINRLLAGMFISDDTGSVYLAHSGKIGAGRAGSGKATFLGSRNEDDIVPVRFPDGKEANYILIGRIDDSDFLIDVARFVHGVADFKRELALSKK